MVKNELGKNLMEQKYYKLEDIVFLSKKRMQTDESFDVFISMRKSNRTTKKGCEKLMYISFKDTVSEVFKNDKYLTIGVVDNRMYFRPIETSIGFKIQIARNSKNITCSKDKLSLRIF